MLYKEWTTVRLKFIMWVVLYAGMGLLVTVNFYRATANTIYFDPMARTPLYQTWLLIATILTLFASMVGGLDVLAEEVDRGTISFLLTRPVSRTRIYASKILLNIGALVAALTLTSTVMLIIDELNPHPLKFWEGVGGSMLIMLMGAGIICLSGLIALFAHNVLQTLAFTLAVVVACLISFIELAVVITDRVPAEQKNLATPALATLFLLIIPPLLFQAGLFFFKRKEF